MSEQAPHKKDNTPEGAILQPQAIGQRVAQGNIEILLKKGVSQDQLPLIIDHVIEKLEVEVQPIRDRIDREKKEAEIQAAIDQEEREKERERQQDVRIPPLFMTTSVSDDQAFSVTTTAPDIDTIGSNHESSDDIDEDEELLFGAKEDNTSPDDPLLFPEGISAHKPQPSAPAVRKRRYNPTDKRREAFFSSRVDLESLRRSRITLKGTSIIALGAFGLTFFGNVLTNDDDSRLSEALAETQANSTFYDDREPNVGADNQSNRDAQNPLNPSANARETDDSNTGTITNPEQTLRAKSTEDIFPGIVYFDDTITRYEECVQISQDIHPGEQTLPRSFTLAAIYSLMEYASNGNLYEIAPEAEGNMVGLFGLKPDYIEERFNNLISDRAKENLAAAHDELTDDERNTLEAIKQISVMYADLYDGITNGLARYYQGLEEQGLYIDNPNTGERIYDVDSDEFEEEFVRIFSETISAIYGSSDRIIASGEDGGWAARIFRDIREGRNNTQQRLMEQPYNQQRRENAKNITITCDV